MNKALSYKLLIVGILIFTLAIRSININKFGLGGDEKYTIMVMHGISWEGATQPGVFTKAYFTPKDFWDALSFKDFDDAIIRTDNGNSATYYGLLYAWSKIVGLSDGNLRFLGVLFDALTAWLLFLFGKNILNRPLVGIIAASLAAVEPFLIGYSHQIRNYPVGIFFTLLSFYLFFLILKNIKTNSLNNWLLGFYALSIVLAVLSHFYTALFIFCQGVLLLVFYLKDFSTIKKFILPYGFVLLCIGWWFTMGSGRETFPTLKVKDEIFKNIANNPPEPNTFAGWVDKPSFANFMRKLNPIMADSFLVTNNISEKLSGKLNFMICIFLSAGLWLLYHRASKAEAQSRKFYYMAMMAMLVIFYFVFNVSKIYHLYFSVILLVFYQAIYSLYRSDFKIDKQFLLLSVLVFILPMSISVLGAVKAGHTANIYHKYLSYGFPIYFLFLAMAIYFLIKQRNPVALILCILPIFYNISNAAIWKQTLNDSFPKYTIFAAPRISNPYLKIAQDIEKLYAPGDTVIYPSYTGSTMRAYDKNMQHSRSVIDAQLTNIYLPKTANYLQKVNAAEESKVFLYQNKEKKYLQLFDFEVTKYRY